MRVSACSGLAFAALVALPATASAYEDEITIAVEAGWAGIPNSNNLPVNGLDLALTVGVGLNDAWGVRALGTFNLLFGDDRLRTGMIGAEAIYLLDIVRFVPIFGFGMDAVISRFRGETEGDFAMHALLGVDFLINPRWLVGASGRLFWITTNNRSLLDALLFTAAFRVGIRFGLR